MKILNSTLFLLAAAAFSLNGSAQNYAWPEKYEGVMLQGFFWDSYKGTNNSKWTTLTEQADELSESFKLIWVPNSAKCASSPSMGYDPVYWFTRHTSSFGTENELRTMIETFKSKGTGIIEDVVVNHRSGTSTWTNFPSEKWNGVTYKLGPEHICRNDEVANQPGQATPTGAYDTGEGFNGARDLDHTNATVQENVKAYCTFLLTDLGYVGFRYDMVKGYKGEYTGIYNRAAKPTYSVGEYFDGSYDAVAAWIEATGRQSAAFDFPLKFQINSAFSSNDMTKLVWLANGTKPQPAGMIHYGYQQYSVTFVDNHDTYRDQNKFTGNVLAANAFILCSPGTPCIFLPHWQSYKTQLKKMIAVRNAVGVHNQSSVNVLKTSRDCYMAEVTGSKGKLVVRIGSSTDTPAGYFSSDIKTSGTGYCIWSKTNVNVGGGNDDPTPEYPKDMYLIGNLPSGHWTTSNPVKADTAKDGVYTWNEATVEEAAAGDDGYFSFVTSKGTNWDAVNASDRYGATSNNAVVKVNASAGVTRFIGGVDASGTYAWKVKPGTYTMTLDLKKNQLLLTQPSSVEEIEQSDDTETLWFNLQGIPVANPEHGIFIRVKGNKREKVAL